MLNWRKDKTWPREKFSSSEEYWTAIRSSVREKADHNKAESQVVIFCTIAFSLSAPLFIAFGSGMFLGKVCPSILSAMAAGSTSWLQIRQPQRLWSLYRGAQRRLENEKVMFDLKGGEYERTDRAEKQLAERTSEIVLSVHEEWQTLTPSGSTVSGLISGSTE